MLPPKQARTIGSIIGFCIFAIPLTLLALYLKESTSNLAQKNSLAPKTESIESPLRINLRANRATKSVYVVFANQSNSNLRLFLPALQRAPLYCSINGQYNFTELKISQKFGSVLALRPGDSYYYKLDISKLPKGKTLGVKYDTTSLESTHNLWRGKVETNRVSIP